MMTDTQKLIASTCDEIKAFLLAKNRSYGDSALNPIRMFSKADAVEQIKVRIDDKLSRTARGQETERVPENTTKDLIGYLMLLLVAEKIHAASKQES
jgi:hypothetical protein